ncbi:hypothetical protein [uncultured Sphingomonas sp.]|uniref:hypothetical protein n=1 Tax=uncultured Sphingomonas sp. TaxID=158754 RepID=UPI0025F3D3F5|nr:hypothetical protein [uncultured Sphingomonas sp.]
MLVVDMTAILPASSRSGEARPDGSLTATLSRKDRTGWHHHTGMPDPVAWKRDMAGTPDGTATPVFRIGAQGKGSIFMPPKS